MQLLQAGCAPPSCALEAAAHAAAAAAATETQPVRMRLYLNKTSLHYLFLISEKLSNLRFFYFS